MARALYHAYRTSVLSSPVNLSTATLKVALTDHGVVTPNVSTHDFYNDINAGTVALSGALTGKTLGSVAVGTFDADDVTFTAVTGNSVESFTIINDTGTASTSNLIAYWDDATGLPVTPNGGNIIIQWNASGIFTF